MNKPKKERAAQMAQTPFLTDEFKIKIYPPTFKDVQTAYAYFTRNRDQFKSDYADDKDEDFAVDSPYLDTQDVIETIGFRQSQPISVASDGQHDERAADGGTTEKASEESSTIDADE